MKFPNFFNRTPAPLPPKLGMVELTPSPGVIYAAQGRLSNSPGFLHEIKICPASRVVQNELENYRQLYTEPTLDQLMVAEKRRDMRQFLDQIFRQPPNAIICITATPLTASQRLNQPRTLLATSVRINRETFDSRSLIRKTGAQLTFTMQAMNTAISGDEAVFMLRYLLLENSLTWNWWMMALLRGYLEAIAYHRPEQNPF